MLLLLQTGSLITIGDVWICNICIRLVGMHIFSVIG